MALLTGIEKEKVLGDLTQMELRRQLAVPRMLQIWPILLPGNLD